MAAQPRTALAQQQWRLVADLRIGGAESGPTSFNAIRDMAVDAKGRIFVLDYQTQEIRLFDPNGNFIRLVGRTGHGPGEFTEPNGMRLAPDGSLWVNDENNSRFVVFSANGAYLKQMIVPDRGFTWQRIAQFDQLGRLMEWAPVRAKPPAVGNGIVRRFDPSITRWDTLTVPPCLPVDGDPGQWHWSYRTANVGGSIGVPFAPVTVFHVDPSGSWWCGAGTDYHLKLMRLGTGETIAEMHLNGLRVPVPTNVRDSAIGVLRRITGVPPGTIDESKVPRVYPQFQALEVDDVGRLWASRHTATGLAIDVWSRAGARIATMDAPPTPDIGRVVVIRGDKYYTVQTDNDGAPVVVRYRIVR